MVHPRARDFSELLDSRDVLAYQLGKVGLDGHNLRLGQTVMSVRVHLVLVECGQTAAEAARCEIGTYHMKTMSMPLGVFLLPQMAVMVREDVIGAIDAIAIQFCKARADLGEESTCCRHSSPSRAA